MTVIPIHPTGESVRLACRSGSFRETTTGQCPKYVQANLIVIPARYAADFRGLCQRNPVCCPLLGENVAPGDVRLQKHLARDSDITLDAPGYNIYRNGKLIQADIPDCKEFWAEDSVAFLIGCSFTFEQALVDAGLPLRHQELGTIVPMYKTTFMLSPSGIFSGNMVVSMRPYPAHLVEKVRDVTRPYVVTHGEPVAWGFDGAARLGIKDILNPEFGEPPVIKEGEIPVFWGCGVTPQNVVMSSAIDGITLGHTPGKMVCLDLKIADILST